MDDFRRKTPEEILRSISEIHKGRLQIILGAVSGSGKTYHMLLEGQRLRKKGLDVVIGVIHTRAINQGKNHEKLEGFDVIPAVAWFEKDILKEDLDVEAIIRRDPEVVLVDELAHRNRPEAIRRTRIEDVRYLLEHNISVITTVNIYELEGMKGIAQRLTGVPVHIADCVADETLAEADEVKLLDVTPEVILKRLQEGSILPHSCSQGEERTKPKSKHQRLYRHDNLAVLRELALRFVAGEVNDDLDKYRQQQGILGPSGASERILVTVQYHWNGSILIRRGQQVAKRLGAELLVACFRGNKRMMSKEEATFKRSMVTLAQKVGASFDEIPLYKDSDVAKEIVQYALQHNITRIVMGQSKRSRWEEILHGSIINKILRKSKNTDVLIVADRSATSGGRVLPAKRHRGFVPHPFRRLSTEEMEKEIKRIKRGKLKIFIGAAPGVGKTFTMLREANELLHSGIDVVIGLLETHGRTETYEQIGKLPIIPKKVMPYKNVYLEEMDTEAIIKRNPEVVLVDELAHTNVPTSRFLKRYEDVEHILQAGISVISTVNIQHVESLTDSVEQITGIRIRETIPDHILHDADEIELVDIAPSSLQERMKEGNIYALDKVEQSLNHFFQLGNLIALRELALREVADDVDERLESWERKGALRGPWRKQETIFVCVNLRDDSERLIRRGFRIAYRLKADWYVAYVQDHYPLASDELSLLDKLRYLTERMGGAFEIYQVQDRRQIFRELVMQMNRKNVTQVIIGHSARTRWEEIKTGSVVQKLLRQIRHMDVLVVADHKPITQ
ncbi:universal stress protein [Brevibacillus laterosporus]|uniref:universal stress protein n=1 Tax=Brevibacillus laterosporus TaxID=1465 RepID=UPI0014443A04|nr:universal stress protein [Brevibacillus laterosporus]NKQ21008.1 universal stress protein [Brevibacillus laterosporus]WNX31620.1 universal stress protein [Brevibacillus laterosporus]